MLSSEARRFDDVK
jgi:exodeoxyribonuclease V alpha subunit